MDKKAKQGALAFMEKIGEVFNAIHNCVEKSRKLTGSTQCVICGNKACQIQFDISRNSSTGSWKSDCGCDVKSFTADSMIALIDGAKS